MIKLDNLNKNVLTKHFINRNVKLVHDFYVIDN